MLRIAWIALLLFCVPVHAARTLGQFPGHDGPVDYRYIHNGQDVVDFIESLGYSFTSPSGPNIVNDLIDPGSDSVTVGGASYSSGTYWVVYDYIEGRFDYQGYYGPASFMSIPVPGRIYGAMVVYALIPSGGSYVSDAWVWWYKD